MRKIGSPVRPKFLQGCAAALVLCSVSGVAMASSSVNLYGVIDLSLYYNSVSKASGVSGPAVSGSKVGITSGVLSGSRWGIKGNEQISDQWSAQFVLEQGVNAQTGTLGQGGLGFGRQSTLALSNTHWGSLQLGRAGTPSYNYMVPFDPFGISGSQAGWGASFGSANGVRPNNLILFQSANMQGWQASIGYSLNTGFSAIYANGPSTVVQSGTEFYNTKSNMRMLTAAIRYNKGPWALLASYDAVYGAGQVINPAGQTISNTGDPTVKAWLVAASYDFKVAKLSMAYGQTLSGSFFGQAAGAGGYSTPLNTVSDGANVLFSQGSRSAQYAIGLTVPVHSQGKVLLSWQALQPTGTPASRLGLATQNIVSAAYVYSITKRTDLYVWASYANNYQTFSTAKSSAIGTGVRHFF